MSTVTATLPQGAAQAPDMTSRISLAVSHALRACEKPRDEIAAEMSEIVGGTVSVWILNSYASQAHVGHRISLERFLALIEVTGCTGLLGFLVEPFGHVAVDRKWAEMIELHVLEAELAAVAERKRAILGGGRAA